MLIEFLYQLNQRFPESVLVLILDNDTIEAMIARMRQLIWHYNEGWLTTSIHFDFAPYTEIL